MLPSTMTLHDNYSSSSTAIRLPNPALETIALVVVSSTEFEFELEVLWACCQFVLIVFRVGGGGGGRVMYQDVI